jgi:hypothetical protein
VSAQGWIFLVGLRVFDLGGMLIWLVWFFRHNGGTDDREDDGGGGGGGSLPPDPPKPGGPGLDLPIADAGPWPTRLRDHGSARRPAPSPRVSPPAWPHRAPRPRRQPAGG